MTRGDHVMVTCGASPLRRLRKVVDSVRPVPAATLTQPELGHQARLVAVVGASTLRRNRMRPP